MMILLWPAVTFRQLSLQKKCFHFFIIGKNKSFHLFVLQVFFKGDFSESKASPSPSTNEPQS